MEKENKQAVDMSISVDDKTKSNEVDKGSTETKTVDETKKVEETAKDTNQTEKTEEKKDGGDENVEKTDEQTTEETPNEVSETPETGNGVRVEDLVTKEELTERLAALEAKFDAVLKENGDLKEKLSGMEEKYERKDFGTFQKQGMVGKDKDANNTFDEYAKQFM